MKRLLTLLFFAFFAISSYGQVVPNLPSGTVPFGTGLFRAPDGDIWGGSKFDGYTNLGNWQRVADSLGAKINWSDTTLIATKNWVNAQIDNIPTPDYPVESVTGTLVDITDPKNPVINIPTPEEVGALAPGDNISELVNDVPYLTTETDPVYSGDPASGITQNDIDAWDAKQDAITGAATTVVSSNLTPSRALISNGSGKIAVSPVSSTELAFLDGVTSNVQDQLDAKIPLAQKGASNGVAPIGSDGKIPGEYLPSSGSYKGTWDASTNTPTIADGVGTNGDRYRVSVGGTVDLGSGPITFVAGDDVIYNGTVWQRSPSGVTVTSVAGKTGDVVLNKADVGLGNVDNTSDLDKPISTAVQNALDLKLDASEIANYYTKTQLQTSGQSQVHWDNITNVPGGLGAQTLSLTAAGNLTISGGNAVYLHGLGDAGRSPEADMNAVTSASFGSITTTTLNAPPNLSSNRGGYIQMTRVGNPGRFQLAVGNSGDIHTRRMADTGNWSDWVEYGDKTWISGNYVTLSTNQNITGEKTFGSVTNFNGSNSAQHFFRINSQIYWRTGVSTAGDFIIHRTPDGGSTANVLNLSRATGKATFAATVSGAQAESGSDFITLNQANGLYLLTSSPAGSITTTDIDNWNAAAQLVVPETVVSTTVNFTIDWQNDTAPNSGGKTYAELHGDHFTYSAFYEDGSGAEVNYSPAVKITRNGSGAITTVQFGDIQTGNIVIK